MQQYHSQPAASYTQPAAASADAWASSAVTSGARSSAAPATQAEWYAWWAAQQGGTQSQQMSQSAQQPNTQAQTQMVPTDPAVVAAWAAYFQQQGYAAVGGASGTATTAVAGAQSSNPWGQQGYDYSAYYAASYPSTSTATAAATPAATPAVASGSSSFPINASAQWSAGYASTNMRLPNSSQAGAAAAAKKRA
jgi:hypothetical protein